MDAQNEERTWKNIPKAERFRNFMSRDKIAVGVGSHDALSAKLIEKYNFDFIWASSLEVSSSHGVPDCSILTMTQFLAHAKMMNDNTNIPLLLDADTGYGNALNVIELVKECERIGIAAICMEDKTFPKQNSLYEGCTQKLLPIGEFCGKIKAVKATQKNPNFMMFARIESLIAGLGVEDALERAEAYIKAGVDGIMIHSKSKDPQEILDFVKAFKHDVPLLLVPTTYKLTREEIQKLGKVKYMIFANHLTRAKVSSMRNTLIKLKDSGDIKSVEKDIAPLSELFDIVDMESLKENEKRYL